MFIMELSNLPILLLNESFDPRLPTAVYVHDFLESGKFDLSTDAIRGAYFGRGGYNTSSVDWSHYSKHIDYYKVVTKLEDIAESITEAILRLVVFILSAIR